MTIQSANSLSGNAMKTFAIASSILAGLGLFPAAHAEDAHASMNRPGVEYCPASGKDAKPAEATPVPNLAPSVTQHRIAIDGKSVSYTATAGTMLIRNQEHQPVGQIGYIAYTRQDPGSAGAPRPLMFAFNGGPGSSSLMLHMGLLGPKRVLVADPGSAPPPPYKTVNNAFSMIDKADIVLIDPMGTGLSRPVCNGKLEEFLTVDADADSVSRFIARYLSVNNRWASPKYLLGESYGTVRAAVIANHMLGRFAVKFDGVVLLSMATDFQMVSTGQRSNERPLPAFLPGFAAVAWYHHRVAGQPPALEPFLDDVRKFAAGPYSAALAKGDALSDEERDAVAAQMHRYIGLSEDYIKTANLRVTEFGFAQELFRDRRETVSRLDGRFVGLTLDPLQKGADYDPALAAIVPTYSAVLRDYLYRDLKLPPDQEYVTENRWVGDHFDLRHQPDGGQYGGDGPGQSMVNAGDDLAQALVQEPDLRVLVLAGYFDIGSPFSNAEYMVAHLGVPKAAAARIRIEYYPSGHMMYVHQQSLEKLKRDLSAFIDGRS